MRTDRNMLPPCEGKGRALAWLLPAAALMAVALLYSASLDAPFHFDDDYYVVRNEPIRNLSEWRSWPWADYGYRVLYELSLGLNMSLGGMNPWGYHLFNIAGHLLAMAAVWLLTARLIRGTRYAAETPWLPAAAAFLFGVHPLASEPVLYVMARNSGWSAMLMLWAAVLALGAYDRARAAPIEPLHPFRKTLLMSLGALSALVLWVAALLFKQTAIVLPALLFLIWLWRRDRPVGRREYAGMAVLAACGLGVLWVLRRGFLADYPLDLKYLATQFVIGADAWYRAILPHGMNIEHDYALRNSLWSPPVMAALALHMALLGLGWLWLRRKRFAGLAILWAYVTVLPTNSILVRADYLSDRHLYLFTLGGVWALLDVASFAALWLKTPARRRVILSAGYALLIALCVLLTGHQVWLFRDRTRLLEHAVKLSPNHMRALINLGHQYESAGKTEEAASLYERCVEQWRAGHDTQFPQRHVWASMAFNNLGTIAAGRAKTDAQGNKTARPFFEKALEIDPMNGLALDNLAIICLEEGAYQQLLTAAERQVQGNAAQAAPRLHRGSALAALGRYDEAVADLRLALDKSACAHISSRLRARALGALIGMRSHQAAQPFAQRAADELNRMREAGEIQPGRIWTAPPQHAPQPLPQQ